MTDLGVGSGALWPGAIVPRSPVGVIGVIKE